MNKKSNRNDENRKIVNRFISPKEIKELGINLEEVQENMNSKNISINKNKLTSTL